MSRTPVLFIGHGSPMNTLERNGFTDAWRALGGAFRGRARCWSSRRTGTSARRRSPRCAGRARSTTSTASRRSCSSSTIRRPGIRNLPGNREAVKPQWVGLDRDQWGLDHGTWSVLAHLYPKADVPVVQLSINALSPLDYHLELARRARAAARRGVMILGSGNVVHNLGRVQWNQPEPPSTGPSGSTKRSSSSSRALRATSSRSPSMRDYALAVPTPDHFIPLLYLAGLPQRRASRVSRWSGAMRWGRFQ